MGGVQSNSGQISAHIGQTRRSCRLSCTKGSTTNWSALEAKHWLILRLLLMMQVIHCKDMGWVPQANIEFHFNMVSWAPVSNVVFLCQDVCRGDSGGALYVQHEPGIDTIEAVVSGGVGLCGKGYPRWWIKIASYRDQLYKIGLPGKLILGDYFQENRTSREPFLLLRISFPGSQIFIQLPPEPGSPASWTASPREKARRP